MSSLTLYVACALLVSMLPACLSYNFDRYIGRAVAKTALAASLFIAAPQSSMGVSGGGKDFANKDLTDGEVKFEGGKFVGKDFTGVKGQYVSFKGADLKGARFYKSNVDNANFEGANLGTASFEGAGVEGANFENAVLTGSYLSLSFEKAGNIKGADFTDALITPVSSQENLCKRADATGTNPKTGVLTRDSLMCE